MGSIPIHFRSDDAGCLAVMPIGTHPPPAPSPGYHTRMKILTTLHALAAAGVSLALIGCGGSSTPPGVTRDFVAVTIAGDEVSGESIRGQVTIIDFWAVF